MIQFDFCIFFNWVETTNYSPVIKSPIDFDIFLHLCSSEGSFVEEIFGAQQLKTQLVTKCDTAELRNKEMTWQMIRLGGGFIYNM